MSDQRDATAWASDLRRFATLVSRLLGDEDVAFGLLDADRRWVLVNDVLAGWHSLPAAEHPGRTVGETTPDVPGLDERIDGMLREGRSHFESVVVGRNRGQEGERTWRVSYLVLGDDGGPPLGLAVIARDITRDERARTYLEEITRELDRERSTLRLVLDQVPVGVVVAWGQEHRYVLANELARSLQPPDVQELVGLTLEEAFVAHPDALARVRPLYDQAWTTGTRVQIDSLRLPSRDGEPAPGDRYYDLSFAPVKVGGIVHGILVVYVEVTEQVRRRRAIEDRLAAEHELAVVLQRSLMPEELPALPGLDVAAHYEPSRASLVGGDFYDAFVRGDEHVLVLGDVAGKGPLAATTTGLVRHALRAASHGTRDTVTLTRLVNALLLEHGGDPAPMCTLVVMVLAPDEDGVSVRYVRAGHPPPIVVRRDGQTAWLGGDGPLLGAVQEIVASEATLHLGPGDGILLYTDGLTEAHAPGRWLDPAEISAALAAVAGRPATELLAAARDLVEDAEPLRDDLALLAVSVRQP